MSRPAAIAIAILIGTAAGLAAAFIPHPIRLGGVSLGDIGLPVAGVRAFREGGNPYDLQLRIGPHPMYPFTAMMLLWPVAVLPMKLIVPSFLGLSSAALAYGMARHEKPWRLLLFLSPPYWAAIEAVQWSPLVTASLLLPALLPATALAKPQLVIVTLVAGRWSIRTIGACAALALISIIIWPAWPMEWLRKGNFHTFVAHSPLLVMPGFVLLAAAIAWRSRGGRLLLAMSIPPQRYFYDQLPLFLIPKTLRQMLVLLATSWSVIAVALWRGWYAVGSGVQPRAGMAAVVTGLFLPALVMVLLEHRRSTRLSSDVNP